jgi:hypothetical protein
VNTSLRTFAIVFLLGVGAIAVQAQENLSGMYITTINSQTVSQENFKFTTSADGSITSEADIKAGQGSNHIVTRAGKSGPQSFELTNNQGGLNANFNNGTAKITITGQTEREVITQASVILENGVWH